MIRRATTATLAAALALAALALAAVSCRTTAVVPSTKLAWSTASVDEGARIFRAACAGCHGEDGRARTPAAEAMFPRPRDLVAGEIHFRSTTDDLLPLRRDLVRTLARGLPGTQMPAWGRQLSERELMSVVLFLETLSPRFHEDDPPEPDDVLVDLRTLKAPAPTQRLLARGRQVFDDMKCWECHGRGGRGDGPSAPTLHNRDGSRADVFDFTYGRYKGGTTPEAVYRTFMTGLDGTPMPSYADTLTNEDDRWALVYYCLSLSRLRGAWFYLSERPTWEDPALSE